MRSAAFGLLFCMPRFAELVFGFVFASFQKPREFLSSLSSGICELDGRCGNWVQVRKVKGEPVTLTPGQTFYEAQTTFSQSAATQAKRSRLKFLMFLLKDKDAPVLVPVKEFPGE